MVSNYTAKSILSKGLCNNTSYKTISEVYLMKIKHSEWKKKILNISNNNILKKNFNWRYLNKTQFLYKHICLSKKFLELFLFIYHQNLYLKNYYYLTVYTNFLTFGIII